ncbi:hypothetical protein [Brachybacterium paraconglomeratum]|uniref:hypothetical protein n=1 Tax=Brachybacterium paraconglomeratum TaxID=173362 RepID=UPI0022E439D7|nr:hypothetical protein [Brachybacterium paraconglomeratum]
MRADSEAQREDSARATRPYVYVRLVPGLWGAGFWDSIIENTGKTAAYELTFDLDSEEDPGRFGEPIERMRTAGLTLPPGARIRTAWYAPKDLQSDPPEALGYRLSTVTLRYQDSAGKQYVEAPTRLTADDYGLTPSPSEGPKKAGTDTDSILKNIENALRTIARNIGESNR